MTDDNARHATNLELFLDLVFVFVSRRSLHSSVTI
jgi:low temperature requirement protein LtrA